MLLLWESNWEVERRLRIRVRCVRVRELEVDRALSVCCAMLVEHGIEKYSNKT